MKIAVVTAITGGKDNLIVPTKYEGVDNILFTDTMPRDNYMWDARLLPEFSMLTRPHRRNAKTPKILPFLLLPEYDYIVWRDGGYQVKCNPHILIKKYLNDQDKDIAAFKHDNHKDIYEEAEVIKRIGFLEDANIIDEQVAAYRKEGLPEGYGLSCNAAMIWRNCPATLLLQLTWFEQVCRYSSRDQMSLFYSLWKTNTRDRFTYIDGHWEKNNEIKRVRSHANARM